MKQESIASRQRRRRFSLVLIVCTLLIAIQFIDGGSSIDTREPQLDPSVLARRIESGEYTLATKALGQLAVAERTNGSDYQRSAFSDDWAERNGCDMRNRVLQRDLVDTVLAEDNCTVLSGTLTRGPYSQEEIRFERGIGSSNAIHIEHIVAVSDAWQKGAQKLSTEKRQQFYNDPLNLIAVDGPTNIQKGSQDAAGWLPDAAYRCRYIARQIAVKQRYNLWLSPAEHRAMSRQLQKCPLQVLPLQPGA